MGSKSIRHGNAGEYFVAGELERRGWHVAVPMSNTPSFDLLAVDSDDISNQICIQVKTNFDRGATWVLGKKNIGLISDNLYYILVSLNSLGTPEYYILHSKDLSNELEQYYNEKMEQFKTDGKVHKKCDMRMFIDKEKKYKDNWIILNKR